MKKSEYVKDAEVKRFFFLQEESKRIKSEMEHLTPDSSEQERKRLVEDYAKVESEMQAIRERIELTKADIRRKIMKLHTKTDGSDLQGFDEDIQDFNDALYDYYEGRKKQLYRFYSEINAVQNLSFVKRIKRAIIKRKILNEISTYTKQQEELLV